MWRSRTAAAALAGVLAIGAAEACFIDIPWQLIDHRYATMTAAPTNSFAWEAAHLVPAAAAALRLQATESDTETPDQQRDAAERAGFTPAQVAALHALRATPPGAPPSNAADLPPAVRLYTAGAVAFAAGNIAAALPLFTQVAALPPDQAAPRLVWATYMLGRSRAKLNDPAGALEAFAATRAQAARGMPDPLGLANASLGESAALRLAANDIPAAVALYAEQAADGSYWAVQSLRMVAARLMARPQGLGEAASHPLVQRLLVIYALGLTGDYLHAAHTNWPPADRDGMRAYDGFNEPDPTAPPALTTLFKAIIQGGVAPKGTDRLAVLAYQLYENRLAAELAERDRTPLGLWVLGKLAFRDDRLNDAARLFAQALHDSAAASNVSVEPSTTTLLRGETGLLTLVRGDFMQAMGVLWPVADTYWGDVAYLAERVLTTRELRAFVDAHPHETRAHSTPGSQPGDPLRNLLARRLMRDGRLAEAQAYFDAPDLRAIAAAYSEAQQRSLAAFWAADRAKAAWQAAQALRWHGMELMGTELAPDHFAFDGAYDIGYGPGRSGPFADGSASGRTSDISEQARYDASRPRPDLRFHYRYLAVAAARRAADNLPPRSQAYAAVLCQATRWMQSTHDDEQVRALYARYLAHGAIVPFATHFGHHCPYPDFGGLWRTRTRLIALRLRDAKAAALRPIARLFGRDPK